jgi:hypothetical protein
MNPKKKQANKTHVATMKWEENTSKRASDMDLSFFSKKDDPFLR